MIEMGYYTACLIIQFFEVRRKDFYQMFIHHVATVFLIGYDSSVSDFSFVSNSYYMTWARGTDPQQTPWNLPS